MTSLAPMPGPALGLPSLIDRATRMLAGAKTAAEVLEAREAAGLAYDAARRAARLSRAKAAHDDLVAAAHRAQAHALEIEAAAKRRLADEYDAAQARGEAASPTSNRGNQWTVPDGNGAATAAELGLSRKAVHDARLLRDAEAKDPGIVRRTLDDRLVRGEEPTRTALRKMVTDAALRGLRPQRSASRRNPLYVPPTPPQAAWQHVTGTFRAFAEWASDANLALARQGMREARGAQFHELDARAIAEGSAAFNQITEWFDAE